MRVVCIICLLLLAGQAAANTSTWSIGQSSVSPEYILCKHDVDCLTRTVKIVDTDTTTQPKPTVTDVIPKIREFSVKFRLASSALSDKARDDIKNLVKDAGPHAMFIVTGMTDKIGSKRFNQRLAHARARSVQRLLQKSGVQADRIAIKSSCCVDFPPTVNPPARRAVIRISDIETGK